MEEKVVGSDSQARLTGEYTLHVSQSVLVRNGDDEEERCRDGEITEVWHHTEQLGGRQSSIHERKRRVPPDGRREDLTEIAPDILLREGGIQPGKGHGQVLRNVLTQDGG